MKDTGGKSGIDGIWEERMLRLLHRLLPLVFVFAFVLVFVIVFVFVFVFDNIWKGRTLRLLRRLLPLDKSIPDDNVDEDDEVGLSRHRWIAGSVLIGFWIVLDRCHITFTMMMVLLMVIMMMMTCESVNRVIMADLFSGSSSNLHRLQW